MAGLAKAVAEAGDMDGVERGARAIADAAQRAEVLADVAKTVAETGDLERVAALPG